MKNNTGTISMAQRYKINGKSIGIFLKKILNPLIMNTNREEMNRIRAKVAIAATVASEPIEAIVARGMKVKPTIASEALFPSIQSLLCSWSEKVKASTLYASNWNSIRAAQVAMQTSTGIIEM